MDGYEGPLDVLLALARGQKVDLLKLSVTRLADQYLAFVREARRRAILPLAADYLVMAAWLAYLKSRLLLPKPAQAAATSPRRRIWPPNWPSAGQTGLHAPRRRGSEDPGDPRARRVRPRRSGSDHHRLDRPQGQRRSHALMAAYCSSAAVQDRPLPTSRRGALWLEEARERCVGLRRSLARWTALDARGPAGQDGGPSRASYIASTLSAGLEMVREGDLEARQLGAFAEVYLRAGASGPGGASDRSAVDRPDGRGAVFAAAEPLAVADLAERLPAGADVPPALAALMSHYQGRGVELARVGDRWRLQTAPDLAHLMTLERQEPRRLSRAAQETLAIIAYHQPVTRAEIEAIAASRSSAGTLDLFMELDLVTMRGRRRRRAGR